jgi:hypothetical protein
MNELTRQPSLDRSTLAVDKMGIQQSLSRNGNFCPGPRHRDMGYRNENGDRSPQRSVADWCRCVKIRSDAGQMESLKRLENGKDQTPMLWGSNAMQQSSITP